MLETPLPPFVKQYSTNSLSLAWKVRVQPLSSRNKVVIAKMLGDWTGSHNEEDRGVSIEAAFAKYDRLVNFDCLNV